ncbi:MAG: hypothetical protein KVP17_000397 [Porospora cf. gigantea B]|uniref:uncharacterized protein n=2 Tax=Porospora cf. gigantea B TaxID=2853592 RepID=UPI003571C62A|nr:MAG: hypothetical protein KVP17_000397 [Porospora cf. gigantea B]
MVQPLIAPSVLASDFSQLAAETRKVCDAGADWVHLDLMDGHFVPNISFGPPVVQSLRKACPDLFFDAHLMVTDPGKWVAPLAAAKVDLVTFHWEAVDESLERAEALCEQIRSYGMKAGIVVKPKTPVKPVFPLIEKGLIFNLLIMTVEPGFGGQSFMHDMMPKVQAARSMFPDLHIQVDGGLNRETAAVAMEQGANVIVAGTFIFRADDIRSTIADLRRC